MPGPTMYVGTFFVELGGGSGGTATAPIIAGGATVVGDGSAAAKVLVPTLCGVPATENDIAPRAAPNRPRAAPSLDGEPDGAALRAAGGQLACDEKLGHEEL